jgi:hypothetical protein
MKLHRHFIADGTMWTNLAVVSSPSLAFCARLVEARERIRIQTLGSELAIERLDECIVRRLAWPAKIERDTLHVGPQIKLSADKLRAVVDADTIPLTQGACHRVITQGQVLSNRKIRNGAMSDLSNFERKRCRTITHCELGR